MKTLLATASLLICAQAPKPPSAKSEPAPRRIELAICLDTSGSMNGLIDAARRGLWAIVNELALTKPTPDLRIALLTYGNNGHDRARGWVRVHVPFTEDLDRVSAELFGLTTNGGTELVGRVVRTALDELAWSNDPRALRLVVVAGNESADQDREVPYAQACRAAIARGIMVNAIYCGNPGDAVAAGWRRVAELADGRFFAIDQDHGHVAVKSPFDEQLAAASKQLNETYLPYGQAGRAKWVEQKRQDENAEKAGPEAAATRATCKSGGLYRNSSWDLVDACREKRVDLAKIDARLLPERLRKMSVAERKAHVAALEKRRKAIQARIRDLTAKRDAYVLAERKRRALDASRSFDFAMLAAIREQAKAGARPSGGSPAGGGR